MSRGHISSWANVRGHISGGGGDCLGGVFLRGRLSGDCLGGDCPDPLQLGMGEYELSSDMTLIFLRLNLTNRI